MKQNVFEEQNKTNILMNLNLILKAKYMYIAHHLRAFTR